MDVLPAIERISNTASTFPRTTAALVFVLAAVTTMLMVKNPQQRLEQQVHFNDDLTPHTTQSEPSSLESSEKIPLNNSRVSAQLFNTPYVAISTLKQKRLAWPADGIYQWEDAKGRAHFGDAMAANHLRAAMRKVSVNPNVVQIPRPQTLQLAANGGGNETRCRLAEQSLKKIRERMRRGYKASEQKYLHGRELKAMAQRREYCR